MIDTIIDDRLEFRLEISVIYFNISGLGDSSYPKFNLVAKKLSRRNIIKHNLFLFIY